MIWVARILPAVIAWFALVVAPAQRQIPEHGADVKKTKAQKKKTAVPAPKPVVQHLSVDYQMCTHVDRHGTGEYDGDDVSSHMDGPFSLRHEDERGSWEFIVPGELRPSYWVVWVRYSTGDSFSSSRGNVAWVDAYATKADAEHVIAALQKHKYSTPKGDYHWTCKVTLPSDGSVREISVSPWSGYFEGIESIEMKELTVSQ